MRAIATIFVGVLGAAIMQGQSIIPSIDTMPPVLSRTDVGCGVYEFTATELRNIPDPPYDPPRPNDQVETGIASVSIFDNPRSVNAKLTLITDVQFPRVDPYKRFVFRVEPLDKTKRATIFLFVRDHAGNLASQQLVIEPTLPVFSTTEVNVSLRVNQHAERTITLRNATTQPQVLQTLSLSGSGRMSIVSGGTVPLTIPAGGTHDVVIAYDPILASEAGDEATLTVTTACGVGTATLRGVGLVGRLATEDWNAGRIDVGEKLCKAGGFVVRNNGTAAVTVTGFTSSDPEVTVVTDISAANPRLLQPGEEVAVTELCYEPLTEGVDDVTVKVVSDADDGDVDCIVRGEGIRVSSVADAAQTGVRPWYDRSADAIHVDPSITDVTLVDLHGRSVMVRAHEGCVAAGQLPPGAYYLVLRSPSPHAVPVLILR